MQKLLLLLACILPVSCFAIKWQVGSTGALYNTPGEVVNLVNDGDTVEIFGKEYAGDVCVWTKNDLVLIGVNGRPHLRANGNNAQGKGIWVIAGNNIRVENIEFSEAVVPDENGAGIRAEGRGLHIIQCYFHHNENGILANNAVGKIVVERSEFGYNGLGDPGQTHNIYINKIDTALIQFNYFHHASIGHEFKSRARVNYILYNRFSNEADGTASRNIDLPNGGLSYIIGNIIQQGPDSENSNLVGYGLEGLSNTAPHALYIINNSFVNNRSAGSFLHVQNGIELIKLYNNIFAGNGTILNFGGSSSLVDSSGNLIRTNISSVGFVYAATYNYQINSSSPAVDGGTAAGTGYNGFSLSPVYEYLHIAQGSNRLTAGGIDIGAYEFMQTLPLNLIAISAAIKNRDVLLQWQTTNETGLLAFEIERSTDGVSFERIASAPAFNTEHNNYSYTDPGASKTIYYFRLKIIEQDGRSFFSKIVITNTNANAKTARVAVNGNNLHILDIPDIFKNTHTTFQLYDYAGRKLYQQQYSIRDNTVVVKLPGNTIKQALIIALNNKSNRLVIPIVLQ